MKKPIILIVDDEPFNVDYLAQEIEELDIETIVAVDGLDALNKVRTEAPDLVLLDIMMPIMDGFEALTRLKADPSTRDIPVIVISAHNDLKNVVHGISLGADDYLPKPFEPILLRARIISSLEKKRLRDLEHLYLHSLEREMDIARDIQMGFLPTELPQVQGWEIAAYFQAAREVAGDFYDAFLLPDGKLLCVIGDICDKGVGAALFMTLFRSLIRATATSDIASSGRDMKNISPALRLQNIISFTNNYIAETHGEANMFATIFIGIFDLQENTLTYINCGNQPPYMIKSGGSLNSLQPTGPAVGMLPDAHFTTEEISFENNDLLLAFTDGIPDALNSGNESFGTRRLLPLLNSGSNAPALLLETIASQLREFIGDEKQFDDITLLAVTKRSDDK